MTREELSMRIPSQAQRTHIRALLDWLDAAADGRFTPGCAHHWVGAHEATWIGRVLLAV